MLFPDLRTLLQRESKLTCQRKTRTIDANAVQQVYFLSYPFPKCSSPHVRDQPRHERTKTELHQIKLLKEKVHLCCNESTLESSNQVMKYEFKM